MAKILTIKEQLLKTPLPKANKRYVPVSHKQMIEMTMEEIDKRGMKVLSEQYGIGRYGNQATGFYEIGSKEDTEMNIKLGWHNSYDKTMPVRWAIGAHIIICGNGMVRGDIGAFKRKHTGSVLEDYREQVRVHVESAGEMFRKIIDDKEKMKNIEITKRTASELIGRMFLEEDIITATQMSIIKKEMENPSYDYKAPGTAWELYNHVTVALKEEHPSRYINSHKQHHEFFANQFELV